MWICYFDNKNVSSEGCGPCSSVAALPSSGQSEKAAASLFPCSNTDRWKLWGLTRAPPDARSCCCPDTWGARSRCGPEPAPAPAWSYGCRTRRQRHVRDTLEEGDGQRVGAGRTARTRSARRSSSASRWSRPADAPAACGGGRGESRSAGAAPSAGGGSKHSSEVVEHDITFSEVMSCFRPHH